MAWLSVVEAANLCAVPPQLIRDLVRAGRLPARVVEFESDVAYLVDDLELARFRSEFLDSSEGPFCHSPPGLEDALAGLRAALTRYRTRPEPNDEDLDVGEPPNRLPLPRGSAVGLPEQDLVVLAERVERLLPDGGSAEHADSEVLMAEQQPPAPTQSRAPGRWWSALRRRAQSKPSDKRQVNERVRRYCG